MLRHGFFANYPSGTIRDLHLTHDNVTDFLLDVARNSKQVFISTLEKFLEDRRRDINPTWPPEIADRCLANSLQSELLTAARWTPRAALQRGRTYVWQVAVTSGESTAILPSPPAPPAMFRIASERDHNELSGARRLHPDDHLLHAVLAARAGLRADAKEALQRASVKLDLP